MPTFLKLTNVTRKMIGDAQPPIVLINSDDVAYFQKGNSDNSGETYVRLKTPTVPSPVDGKSSGACYFFVKESIEDIWQMLP